MTDFIIPAVALLMAFGVLFWLIRCEIKRPGQGCGE